MGKLSRLFESETDINGKTYFKNGWVEGAALVFGVLVGVGFVIFVLIGASSGSPNTPFY